MPNMTETYKDHALTSPDKLAVWTKEQRLSWAEWTKLVNQTVNWLDSLDAERKVVAFLLPNGIPFLQLFAGAAMAGWIAVPLDEKWTEQETRSRLELARPSLMISDRDRIGAVSAHDCLREISCMPSERYAADCNANLPFYMGFTSGTSGTPKAFVRSHESWVESFACSTYDFGIQGTDAALIPGSLVHSHFLFGAVSSLYLGGTVWLLEKFSASRAKALIDKAAVNVVYAVPTMIEALLKEEPLKQRVKFISSGAKWLDGSKEKMAALDMQRYELYGASELSFVTVMTEQDEARKPGSVGRACRGVELEIRDADGEPLRQGETGKIFVRSRMLFDGYLQADGTMRRPIGEDGFMTVDDMGCLDEDGYLYIAGRENNMILYGALNIFPEEIEHVLARHPHVEEAAVIGMPDAYWGEIAVAVICGEASKLELQRWCRMELASYKVPRKWVYIDDMPHTISGKIARTQLKNMLETGEAT